MVPPHTSSGLQSEPFAGSVMTHKLAGLVVIATDVRIVTEYAMRLLSYSPKIGVLCNS